MPPSRYLASRPAEHRVGAPRSVYVTMADGCRIAVDVILPDGDASKRWPTVLILTPYVRRFQLAAGSNVEPSPNSYKYRDMFVPRGYAVVVVDARGTGASFGTRDSFRSPRERGDYKEIADWIVAQPWSDGVIGATGISYLGAACDFLASTGHKAVKAIAPLFAVWDTWADNYYPGGMLIKRLALVYDELMLALDHDRRDLRSKFSYFADPALQGPMPVDDDKDGALAREAVKGHLANFRMPDFMSEFKFRDDTLPYDPSFSSASFGPYNYLDQIPEDVAVYAISGWMDGAGYANGTLSRFLTLPNAQRRIMLGPWDHGARVNVSPWRAQGRAGTAGAGRGAALLRPASRRPRDRPSGTRRPSTTSPCMPKSGGPPRAGRRSRAAGNSSPRPIIDWPSRRPMPPPRRPTRPTSRSAAARRRATSVSRASTPLPITPTGRSASAGCSPSPPSRCRRALEIAGHPVVSLWLASSEPDAAVFVYLSEVEADGTSRYVTEGLLRAIHRAEAPAPRNYRTTWPWRTFARKDAKPMPVGEPQLLRFALLPTAWRFAAGSRIRLSIAGGDADHFVQTPHGRPPLLTVMSGGGEGDPPRTADRRMTEEAGDAQPVMVRCRRIDRAGGFCRRAALCDAAPGPAVDARMIRVVVPGSAVLTLDKAGQLHDLP